MSLTLKLPGRRALSEFRLSKLLHQAKQHLPGLTGVRTQFWHFIHLRQALSKAELSTLQKLLTYGPASRDEHLEDDLLLVVPRRGTISPWASKATDIVRHCGLEAVERIERDTAYRLEGIAASKLSAAQRG